MGPISGAAAPLIVAKNPPYLPPAVEKPWSAMGCVCSRPVRRHHSSREFGIEMSASIRPGGEAVVREELLSRPNAALTWKGSREYTARRPVLGSEICHLLHCC